jgi:hypothetical protein
MGAVLFIGRSAGLGDFIEAAASQPQRTITVEQIETRMAAANLSADGRTITVHAQFVTSQQAQEAYRAATAQLGDESSHCRLDTTLIATFPRGMPPAAMPPAAKALQESWSRAGATAQTNDFTYCRVYGIARNETEAKELEELIQSYSFTAGRVRTALPPWSASPVEIDRETMLKARRTLVAASELPPLTDEEQQEMKRQIERVGREMRTDPNPEKSRDRSEKLFQLHAERQRKHYETLKAQGDKYDAAVLDWLASQSQPNPDVPIRDRVRPPPGVAERLGGRPGDKPPARDGTERVSVIRTGLILQLESLSFHDPAAGLPALIHWLTDRGCVDLRFDVYGDDPSDEDNADVGE